MESDRFGPPGIRVSPYDQVMNSVRSRFPHLNKSQIDQALVIVRKRSGDLRGYSVGTLIEALNEYFDNYKPPATRQESNSAIDLDTLEALTDMDICLICSYPMISEMDELDVLECGHKYHTKCIRRWYKEKQTCPHCRSYSLPSDEYPSLRTE